MQVIHGIDQVRLSNVALTIGNFDGVHRGHQELVAAAHKRARAIGSQSVVMTFEPHPSAVLNPDRTPPTLTPLSEKLRCLRHAGTDIVVVVPSRPEFFSLSAEAFIRDMVVARFHPAVLVEGASFRFGRHRQGDVTLLQAAGREHGYELELVEPVREALGGRPDTVISSSLIRQLLSSGTVDSAAHCLGRPYALLGRVIHGAGRGHNLGFPTANLALDDQLVPAEGVYAGRAFLIGKDQTGTVPDDPGNPVPAAISIGRIPTFDGTELAIEAYLLDFEGDLYDARLRIEFFDWLRPQHKYETAAALIHQMQLDVLRTRELFAMHTTH